MKRLLTSFVFILFITLSYAQFFSTENLLAKKNSLYGDTSWKKIAMQIKNDIPINDENDVVYTKIVDLPDMTKDNIFDFLKLWTIENFSGHNSTIKVMDKEIGRIVIEDYVDKIVKKGEFVLSDDVSLKPLIRIDIKDNKVRITCTNSVYYVHNITYTGFLIPSPVANDYQHKISQCYPLVKESKGAYRDTDRKSACKALTMVHISSLQYLSEIEKVLTKDAGLSNDNSW